MLVYNLTNQVLAYRGKDLSPNGGSKDFPELDIFIPDRDKELETKKVIAFGALPSWWHDQVREKTARPKSVSIEVFDKAVVSDSVEVVVTKTDKRRRA
jgi:hypothetical protein